jgi:hypothetical protein
LTGSRLPVRLASFNHKISGDNATIEWGTSDGVRIQKDRKAFRF